MSFDLSTIQRGRGNQPPRVIVYGEHGLGKSTFAAGAPSPIFIQTEDGLAALDTARFPLASSFADVMSAIRTLYSEDHEFQTVVLDSVDWCEQLIVRDVEEKHDEKELSFGKDRVMHASYMRDVLDGLNALRRDKGMGIIMTAHSQVKRFDDPTGESYDRFQMKLGKQSNAIVQEWCDVLGFAAHKVVVVKEDVGFNQKKKRGQSIGRVLHLERSPAFDAKNRLGLPAELDLSWASFADAMTASITI